MFKITKLKTWLTACLFMLAIASWAQTGNPYWSLPPKFIPTNPVPPTTSGILSLPTQSAPGYQGASTTFYGASTDSVHNANAVYYPYTGPSNMLSDAQGNPMLTFINGWLYNQNGFLIDTLLDTLTNFKNHYPWASTKYFTRQVASGWTEACIVPNPGNCSQYYVFTAVDYGASVNSHVTSCFESPVGYLPACYKPVYALVDVVAANPNASGQLGKNLSRSGTKAPTVVDLFASTSTGRADLDDSTYTCSPMYGTPHYACTKLISNSYRLLFVYMDDDLIVYKITSSGIQYVKNYDMSGHTSDVISDVNNGLASELELHEDTINGVIQVALSGFNSYGTIVNLAFVNFSRSTGLMNTSSIKTVCLSCTANSTPTHTIAGIEFSPDGSYVYATHTPNSTDSSALVAINYATPSTPYQFYKSGTAMADFQNSQIELGKDGYMYLIGQHGSNTPRFARIGNPNTPNNTNFTDNYLPLSGYNAQTLLATNHYSSFGGALASYFFSAPIFFLPDQIDQEVYSNRFQANTQCCLFYSAYDKQTYYATNSFTGGYNQTWTSSSNPLNNSSGATATIGEELRIPAGYTVTINNMTLKFSPLARLIIENGTTSNLHGGKLILSGCTLTVDNRCGNDMWPGIQVWGSPTHSQSASSQGYLSTSNNCVIQNAYVGVLAGYEANWVSTLTTNPGAPVIPGNLLPMGTGGSNLGGGGIVALANTTFLNNQKGAVYYDFPYNTVYSTVNNCTFSTNAALLASGVNPVYGIGMYNMAGTGFNIFSSSFIDTYYNNSVTGIYTINSTYNVNQSGSLPSSFSNLKYGINSSNTSGNAATMSCKNTSFINSYYGIYLGYVNNAIIEMNTFKLFTTNCTGTCTKPYSYGIYLDNSTGFSIRADTITKYNTITPTNVLYGIIANNTGSNANIIFGNTFDNLWVGNQAQFQNYVHNSSSPLNSPGLQYICNTFNQGTIKLRDIYVPGDFSSNNVAPGGGSVTYPAGIAFAQGTGNSGYPKTGGNSFSHTSGAIDFYIDTNSYNSNYYYYCTSGCPVTSSLYYPLHRKNTNASYYTLNVDCSSNPYTCPGCRVVDPNQAMLNLADYYKTIYDSIASVIDGGNPTALVDLINSNAKSNSIYNSLNNSAPYLSDGVLKAYINSSHPTSDIAQILTNCSPLTDDVKKTLRGSSLSQSIKSQLNSLQVGNSKVFDLSVNKGNALSARHLLLDDLIRKYINDTVTANVKKGYALMKVKALELPARNQLQTGIDLHDSVMAVSALNKVANAEGQSNFVKLHTILLQNLNKPASTFMRNASVLSAVQALAADSSDRLTYLKANTLLQVVGLSKYVPYVQPLDAASIKVAARTAQAEEETTSIGLIKLESSLSSQPNPFTESTTVKATVVEKTQNAFVVITDMVGKELARYPVQQGDNNININAGNLQQTVMFCTLVVDGVKIKTNKMVLIK